ncbi:MAG: N-acetylglucosamine-6-phosphate deacetylase [Paracoccaceae bacterium]
MTVQILIGAQVFDGTRLLTRQAVVVEAGKITAVTPEAFAPNGQRIALNGGILAPAFLDLQVNGGAGLMINASTDAAALHTICATHLHLGCAGVLPTLITDTPAATAQVIAAGIAAARVKTPGFLGLHLEGPHLDPRRKGAHDRALIRPMTTEDLSRLCDAAAALPALMVTVAPESTTAEQIATLAAAGAVVSLGHTDCSYDTARAALAAGARCVTHLFNAQSQLGNREPGLVGATLDGTVYAGLIADGIHVHPTAIRIALSVRPKGIFLVSDCMAFAGSNLTEITLNNRRILRLNGRLTLEDGTLAGADLSLPQALKTMIGTVGISSERALAMATATPARAIGLSETYGYLQSGRAAHMVHLDANWNLTTIWHNGKRL